MAEGLNQDIAVLEEEVVSESVGEESLEEVYVEGEEAEAVVEAEEEIPEEAKEMLNPKQKPRTQKRIVNLIKDKTGLTKENEALSQKLEQAMADLGTLKEAEQRRTHKETTQEATLKMTDIQERRRAAYEEGDLDKINSIDMEFMQMAQQSQAATNNVNNVDPEEYFKNNNNWYRQEGADIGLKKTRYAQGLSSEVFTESKYSHLSASQKCDLISKKTNDAFKENPYRQAAPTDGVTTVMVPKNKIVVTKDHIDQVKSMFPGKDRNFLIKKAKELLEEEKKEQR